MVLLVFPTPVMDVESIRVHPFVVEITPGVPFTGLVLYQTSTGTVPLVPVTPFISVRIMAFVFEFCRLKVTVPEPLLFEKALAVDTVVWADVTIAGIRNNAIPISVNSFFIAML